MQLTVCAVIQAYTESTNMHRAAVVNLMLVYMDQPHWKAHNCNPTCLLLQLLLLMFNTRSKSADSSEAVASSASLALLSTAPEAF